nr:MAG TPA: hypothetical protein [Caudoviricetes sp.]
MRSTSIYNYGLVILSCLWYNKYMNRWAFFSLRGAPFSYA